MKSGRRVGHLATKAVGAALISVLLAALAGGCAKSPETRIVQPADSELSCEQLASELEQLDRAGTDAEGEKGPIRRGLAAAAGWVRNLFKRSDDAGPSEESVDARRSHLMSLQQEKECG